MVIAIREGSEIPIYQQIRDQIVKGISDGRLKTGEQLPTVRALAEEIGINSMTVNKAYQLLKQQGYIMADRRNGARVSKSFAKAPQLSKESRELLDRIIAEAKIGGMTKEEFLEECRQCYERGELPEGAKNFGNTENVGNAGNVGNVGYAGSTGSTGSIGNIGSVGSTGSVGSVGSVRSADNAGCTENRGNTKSKENSENGSFEGRGIYAV